MSRRLCLLVAVLGLVLGAIAAPAVASGPWTPASVPVPQTSNGRLDAVSCVDRSTCIAVGSIADAGGQLRTLVETPDGVNWPRLTSPNPAGARDAALRGVSCVSNTFCVAVGESWVQGNRSSVIELLRGGVWRLSAHPTASRFEELHAVACASTTFCVAVGDVTTRGGRRVLIDEWDGKRWTTSPPPNTGNDYSALLDVACPSTTTCQAVGTTGSADTDTVGSSHDLIDTLSDGSWTQEQFGSDDIETLHGVSCVSVTHCVAVGHDEGFLTDAAQVLTYDGTTWTSGEVPQVSRLDDISCISESFCALTGLSTDSTSWVGRYDGSSFTADESPSAAELVGISCAAPATCYAVGSSGKPVVAIFDGGWSLMHPFSGIGSAAGQLQKIDCVGTSFCLAMGNRAVPGGSHPALAERWDGATWSLVPITNPPGSGAGTVDVEGLSCVSTQFCVASGAVINDGSYRSMLEMWDGTTWTPVTVPARNASLFGVSCVSTTFCLALGIEGIVIRWDGTSWTRTTPLTGDGGSLEANAISCVSQTSCTIVGSGGGVQLFEHFDGTAWTVQPTVTQGPSVLFDVQCLSDDFCIAAGTQTGAGGRGYLTTWNGTHWRGVGQRTSLQPLVGVSCTPSEICATVGGSTILSGGPRQLSFDNSASPLGSIAKASMNDVACLPTGLCLAVGTGHMPLGDVPFAESKNE